MTRALVRIALAGLAVACHRPAPVTQDPPVVTRRQDPPVPPAVTRRADTVGVLGRETQAGVTRLTFKTPDQRDSLVKVLRRERELWRANAPTNYRYQLNVSCFCPGVKGWLTIEVRSGQPLKAFDQSGKAVPLADWNTYSIDELFDHVEGFAERKAGIQVGFDPQAHFPAFVNASFQPGPDMWTTIEARGLRPI